MKRVVLFLLTNLAVLLVLTTVLRLLGIDRFLTRQGIDVGALLAFSVVVGFTGSIISLLLSKPMAKWSIGAQVITAPAGVTEQWLVDTVAKLAKRAGIGMPEVAVYQGGPNAFATGAFKNNALVAVSSGLLETMSRDEIEAVLGHEIAHAANGDMVTLTLVQGVVNTFVVFLSRVVGFFVDRTLFRTNEDRDVGPGFYITVVVCEILFGILATIIVMWFSRRREFRADRGSAEYLGSARPMIGALERLGALEAGHLPQSIRAMGISDRASWMALFSSHPPIESRIAALQALGR
jgi:heat shock protein HtpX